jgi:hypothetical protein
MERRRIADRRNPLSSVLMALGFGVAVGFLSRR